MRSKGWADFSGDYSSEITHTLSSVLVPEYLSIDFNFRYEAPFYSGIRGQEIRIRLNQDADNSVSLVIRNEGDWAADHGCFYFQKVVEGTPTDISEWEIWGIDTDWHNGKIIIENY